MKLLLKNYRPVSNLQYISKLTEKVVFQQTHSHMTINSLYPELQSSYRQHHSTETALLKVMNDVLLNMNSQQVTPMVFLDLNAAFDTVNHDILSERLDKDIGMRGVTLDWFRSYLSNRCQQVCIDGSLSNQCYPNCAVPQGSCLGPLLFVMLWSSNVISPRLILTRMIPSYTRVSSPMMLTPRMRPFAQWRITLKI